MSDAARGFLGSGDVIINPYNNLGVKTGFVSAGDASKFAIKPNSEIKELESKARDTYGQVLATAALQRPADFSITFREANKDTIRLAFMGEEVAHSQGSATVTDEAVVAKLGKWVQLSKQNLASAGFSITNSAESTTYVLGTDYEVNLRLGMVRCLEGGAITADQELKANFSAGAISGHKIRGAVRPQLRCEVILDGKNVADDRPVICRVWECVLTPNAEFDFLADDWNELELQGRLVTPVGKTEPFVVEFPEFA